MHPPALICSLTEYKRMLIYQYSVMLNSTVLDLSPEFY